MVGPKKKKKKKAEQSDMRQKVYKNTTEFCVGHLLLGTWALPLSVVNIPIETQL